MKDSYFYTCHSSGHGNGVGVATGSVVLSYCFAFLILLLPCAHPHNFQPCRSVPSSQREPGCQSGVTEVTCVLGSPLAAITFSPEASKASTVTLGTAVLWKGHYSSSILWRIFVLFFSAVTAYKVHSLREEKALQSPSLKPLFRRVAFWYHFSLTLEEAIRNYRSFSISLSPRLCRRYFTLNICSEGPGSAIVGLDCISPLVNSRKLFSFIVQVTINTTYFSTALNCLSNL